jgi:hypothetical protein
MKCHTRHTRRQFGHGGNLLYAVPIPGDDGSVGSTRGKCAMLWMKSNGVDGINDIGNSMAFEGVLLFVGWR